MLERIAAISIIIGTVLGLLGTVWMGMKLVRILLRRASWGSLKRPFLLILVSLLLTGLPIAINSLLTRFVPLGPLDTVVAGERHLTLTGWDRHDYSVLASCKDAVVVQMANPDVTDDTLQFLDDMTLLRELDLNNSQVTDAGLEKLARLPALRDLRLARTKITDEGFRQYLLSKESLSNLELTGTAVASKTLREWKSDNPDRKYLK